MEREGGREEGEGREPSGRGEQGAGEGASQPGAWKKGSEVGKMVAEAPRGDCDRIRKECEGQMEPQR